MYFPTAEYRLEQIERRRRYRRWVLAVQLAMVCFFADQIFKTWVRGRVSLGEKRPVLGQTLFVSATVDKRGGETQITDHPSRAQTIYLRIFGALACVAIGGAAYLRRRSGTAELYGYGLALGSAVSKGLDLWRYDYVFDTFLFSFAEGRYLPFSLADLSLLLGGYLIVRSFVREWVAPRQLELSRV